MLTFKQWRSFCKLVLFIKIYLSGNKKELDRTCVLLKTRNLRHNSAPLHEDMHIDNVLKWILCILNCGKHCLQTESLFFSHWKQLLSFKKFLISRPYPEDTNYVLLSLLWFVGFEACACVFKHSPDGGNGQQNLRTTELVAKRSQYAHVVSIF